MKPIHAIGIGFAALYVGLLLRSGLKNYLNISL